MNSYLDDIAAFHRQRASSDTRNWRDRPRVLNSGPTLVDALSALPDSEIGIIAEFKRRSPSQGWISADANLEVIVQHYVDGGAIAVSCLTDVNHFGGSLEDLSRARSATDLPILRKDFTVSENDVLDAAEYGASAVLLIAAMLNEDEILRYATLAKELQLSVLMEVHALDELDKFDLEAIDILGVNQRDLHTFEINRMIADEIRENVPADQIVILESGIRDSSDLAGVRRRGFHGALIGEILMRSPEPEALLERLRQAG